MRVPDRMSLVKSSEAGPGQVETPYPMQGSRPSQCGGNGGGEWGPTQIQ